MDTTQNNDDLKPSHEQILYANILFIGAWGGIVILFITYFLYVTGIIPPHVDMMTVIQHWNHGVHEYLTATNSPQGWDWVALLDKGDYLNFVGLVLLAAMTIFCYFFLVKGYWRQKDWKFAIICILEILVLVVAASGMLGSGGH
jgi:hypothetical protein